MTWTDTEHIITEIDAHVEAYRAALYTARDAWEEVGR